MPRWFGKPTRLNAARLAATTPMKVPFTITSTSATRALLEAA
jgi:hypothetical protein